jgi:hypothetical protein
MLTNIRLKMFSSSRFLTITKRSMTIQVLWQFFSQLNGDYELPNEESASDWFGSTVGTVGTTFRNTVLRWRNTVNRNLAFQI